MLENRKGAGADCGAVQYPVAGQKTIISLEGKFREEVKAMALFFIFGWAISALIGILIARSKNRDQVGGCAWGALLGPIGWLILALMATKPPSESPDGRPLRKCPHCAEMVLMEALVCKHCQQALPPIPKPGPAAPPEPINWKTRGWILLVGVVVMGVLLWIGAR